MTYEMLKDNLDGFFAYDTGCTDSGIKNDGLKEECRKYIMSIKPDERRHMLARMVVDLYLNEEAVKSGYGIEDAQKFISWLDEQMGVCG